MGFPQRRVVCLVDHHALKRRAHGAGVAGQSRVGTKLRVHYAAIGTSSQLPGPQLRMSSRSSCARCRVQRLVLNLVGKFLQPLHVATRAGTVMSPFGTATSAWSVWQARGLPLIGKHRGERQFTAFDAAMRATEQGLGVSLALFPLVQPWVTQGRLARVPNAAMVEVGQLYFLSRPLSPSQKR